MPKVSIIIPFHNVEYYIGECLESVINQKLQDIEIICVNDGSTDGSRSIVEEYAKRDCRIKIIDIETRKGQGFARNRAVEIASGEYIGFVDADDYIEHDMFFELYTKASQNNNDITICQAREYDDLNKKFILSDYYSLSLLSDMKDKIFSAVDVKDKLLDINVVLWNKIYKKSYLDKIGEKFPEGYIYEDLPFFFGTFLPAEKIQIVWKNLYIYRINRRNSTMQQFNNKILDRPDMVSLTFEKIKKFDFMADFTDKIKGWIINDLFHRYTLLKENFQREYFFKMKRVFQNLDIEDIDNPYWKKVYHFEGYLMVLNNDFEGFNLKIFTQYLDIHQVEDRIKSVMLNETENLHKIISLNYDKLAALFDIKAGELQSAMDNNLNFVLEAESKLYKEIKEKNDYLSAVSDDKISKTHSVLNSEIKSLYEKNKQNYDALNNLIENKTEHLKTVLSGEEEIKINEVKEKIEQNHTETLKQIGHEIRLLREEMGLKSQADFQNFRQEISEIKSRFETEMNNQKNYYENVINQLQARVSELEKTPVQKLKDKIKKNK